MTEPESVAAPEPAADPDPAASAGTPQWTRVLVLVAAALALLLIGGAAGIWLALRGTESAPSPGPSGAAPTAVDIGFAQDMSTHHLQAVQMASWEWAHSRDPLMQQLAFDMEQTQLEQVGRMKGFLSMWDQPEQGTAADQMAWMRPGAEHGEHGHGEETSGARNGLMPGMATKAELAELRTKTGKALDVRFLQLMLRHHQGGIPMAEYALKHARNGAVLQLARSMVNTQQSEINLMTRLLAERGSRPLPAP